MASIVCGLNPSLISTTRTAISAILPPLFLKEVKEACPGVSMKSIPGSVNIIFNLLR